MGVKSYFIQYKFIIPETLKHSSYTYQKLFRALYGYTQDVYKSNGKIYKYHRKGILSDLPYIRPGKNCVIIPQGALQKLIEFFKTGKNPTHNWRVKGEWKAVYYMNEKDVAEAAVLAALEQVLEKKFVSVVGEEPTTLVQAIEGAVSDETRTVEKALLSLLLKESQDIVDSNWFKETYSKSERLSSFYQNYKRLKAAASG